MNRPRTAARPSTGSPGSVASTSDLWHRPCSLGVLLDGIRVHLTTFAQIAKRLNTATETAARRLPILSTELRAACRPSSADCSSAAIAARANKRRFVNLLQQLGADVIAPHCQFRDRDDSAQAWQDFRGRVTYWKDESFRYAHDTYQRFRK